MKHVLFMPEVRRYFIDLVQILYNNGYFSFLDTSQKYVKDLFDDIETNLPTKQHKTAPPYFNKYGENMKYAVFKKNKRTAWYAFFDTYEETDEIFYLVRYINNNHMIAQHLNN
jgi:hypothetical protein